MNTQKSLESRIIDAGVEEAFCRVFNTIPKPQAPLPPHHNLSRYYGLLAAAHKARADWHDEQGKPEMAAFDRTQAAINADMAAQAEVEPA